MNTIILGKQVLPLPIKRSLISGREADKKNGNMGAWLNGDEARVHYKRVVDSFMLEHDEDSVRMDWFIFSVCADGTYTLRSEFGYERSGLSMDDFEVIKDGKNWIN